MLAQYAHATTDAFSAEERYGKAVATVMFVVSNTTLLVVHASLVAVPLWQQMSAGCTSAREKLHERFAAGANQSHIFELRVQICLCDLLWTPDTLPFKNQSECQHVGTRSANLSHVSQVS